MDPDLAYVLLPAHQISSAPVDMDVDPDPTQQQRPSRKHLRSSDDEDGDLDWSSDMSGRFDDAEEEDDYRSPSAKSVKRRRSNDWPLPEEGADYGHERRHMRAGAGLSAAFKASPRASPRASLASLRARHAAASNSPRHHRKGRQSRFVEASMSDSVSEKPPSIYFRDSKPAGPQHRQSGIFRFGKAIASAFNPFGGWGKTSPESSTNSQSQQDVLNQAEQAYAELKQAGYKGTNKGAYARDLHVNPALADQTWQDIQDKVEYGTAIGDPHRFSVDHGDRTAPARPESGASKRSSFQDLRKGIPFIRSQESSPAPAAFSYDRTSEDSENPGLHRQKSRKELSRQTKLLKRVSNLEEKLTRARRELRELTGNEERMPAPTPQPKSLSMDMDPAEYPRKFVPGALPTLPSERLLDQQATASESTEPVAEELTALPSLEGQASNLEESRPAPSTVAAKSPKRRSKELRPSSAMGKDRSSRKRKSPIPEPLASRNPPPQPRSKNSIDQDNDEDYSAERQQLTESGLLSPPRQAKWQKFEAGDSPGSVERKKRVADPSSPAARLAYHQPASPAGAMRKRSPYARQPRTFSPGPSRSPSSKTTTHSPPALRMRQGRSNLRLVSPGIRSIPDSEGAVSDEIGFSPSPVRPNVSRPFYLQQHCTLDPDRSPSRRPVSLSTLSPSRARGYVHDDDIPPVPPLPKELLVNAAKVHKSPTKKRPRSAPNPIAAVTPLQPQTSSTRNSQQADKAGFQWPEDFF
ncbi:hypothetical protein NUU61_006571 [Penicillium alfredii]|uniref:Nuclear RNA binding protein n=1 Tax=Penicillium alfredii TaxID=1506179 RepID=A0A9W9F1B8_9EURO|nr:uncharacterized protein NUU61_006571 [Penicillium alfredii]KAJ5091701.1 hypothetical protein NUU61_006571 [Penicillium alfredii]